MEMKNKNKAATSTPSTWQEWAALTTAATAHDDFDEERLHGARG